MELKDAIELIIEEIEGACGVTFNPGFEITHSTLNATKTMQEVDPRTAISNMQVRAVCSETGRNWFFSITGEYPSYEVSLVTSLGVTIS